MAESVKTTEASTVHVLDDNTLSQYSTYMVLSNGRRYRNLIHSPLFFTLQASPAPYAKAL